MEQVKRPKTSDGNDSKQGLPEVNNGQLQEEDRHRQPAIVSGCVMRDYQIEGMEWLISTCLSLCRRLLFRHGKCMLPLRKTFHRRIISLIIGNGVNHHGCFFLVLIVLRLH